MHIMKLNGPEILRHPVQQWALYCMLQPECFWTRV